MNVASPSVEELGPFKEFLWANIPPPGELPKVILYIGLWDCGIGLHILFG